MQINRPAFAAALAALAASCAKVDPPTAIITAQQSVNSGALVLLDGTKSTDPQARPLAYAWSFQSRPAGSSAAIQDPQAAKTTFLADVAGDYVVTLVVSNSVVNSGMVPMTITASQCGTSAPNAANLRFSPEAPFIGSTVQFAADVSDPDNAPGCGQSQTLSYRWTLIGMPAGSTASLNNTAAQSPSLSADVSGSYVVQLVVTDSTGRSSAPASLATPVRSCGGAAPTVAVSAAVDTDLATEVTLTATGSDADAACGVAQALSYAWSVVSRPPGSSAVLSDPTVSAPKFTPDVAGTYEFGVQVTDSTGRKSATAFTTVNASVKPVTPTITAPANATVSKQSTASVQARPGMAYAWSVVGGTIDNPAGTFSPDGTINSVKFTGTATGTLTLSCVESTTKNNPKSSPPGTANVNVVPAPVPPTIAAPAPANVTSGFSYAASTTARAGMSYLWTVSNAVITSPNGAAGAAITFIAGTAGVPVSLTVTETNAAGDSATSALASLTVWSPAVVCSITAPANVTAGFAFSASSPAQAGSTYAWQVGGTPVSPTIASGTTSISTTAPGAPGPLAIRCDATNAAGDSTATASVTISVVPAPAPPTILVPNAVNGNITSGLTYTASVTVRAGMTYFWSAGSATITSTGGAAGVLSGGTSSITFVASSTGPLTIACTETNAAGTASIPGNTNLTVVAPPSTPQVTLQATNLTAGTASSANVLGSTGNSFQCTATNATITGGGGAGTFGSPAQVQFTAGNAGALTISCTASNAANTASQANTASGAVWAPAATPTISAPASATTARVYTASLAAHPGARYTWSIDAAGTISSAGGASGVFSADGSTNSILFTSGAVGTRTLQAVETNGAGDASGAGTASVNVVPEAASPVITAPPGQVTSQRTYPASVPARNGFRYSWTITTGTFAGGGTLSQGTTANGVNTVTLSPDVVPDGATGLLTLACTETNAAGDSSASSMVSSVVYPAPRAPTITVVKQGTITPITKVSDGPSFAYVASIAVRAGMHYEWTAPTGMTGTQSGTQGEFFTFSFNAGIGSVSGVLAALSAKELNFINDFASGSTNLTVYSAPTTFTITVTPAFPATAGDVLTAAILARGNPNTYAWTVDNGTINGTTAGASISVTAGSANLDGTPNNMALHVTETNGAGDTSQSTRTGLVYPRPAAPTVVITDALATTLADNANVTAGEPLHGAISAQAGITFAWTATNSNPATRGNFTTFDFTGTNATGSPVALTLSVVASNAIGFTATSATRSLNVYPRPTAPTVVITDALAATLADNANVTAGEPLHGAIGAQAGITFAWTATNSNPATRGNFNTFDFTGTNATGSPVVLTLSVTASNAIGFRATSATRSLNVYPRPTAPTVVITDALAATLADNANVTAGEPLHGAISTQAGITFAWTATNSDPATHGDFTTFDFTGTNATADPVVLTLSVTASNAIGFTATSATRSLNVYPRPATPTIALADGGGGSIAPGADVTAGSFQATTNTQLPTIGYAWTITPTANRANVAGDTTAHVTFDASANADNTNATVTVKIEVSNAIGFKDSTTATLKVHPAPVTPTIHIVGPDGTDGFVTQGAPGVQAQVVARAHMHYAWTYAFVNGAGVNVGTFTNAGGAAGNLTGDTLHNFVTFAVPSDATNIRLSSKELNDLNAESGLGKMQANAVSAPSNVTLAVDPLNIYSGAATALTYTFTGGTGTIDQGVGAAGSSPGTKLVTAIATTTIFTLTVTNAATTARTASATVNVTTPAGWIDLNNTGTQVPPNTESAGAWSISFDPARTLTFAATQTDVLLSVTGGAPWTSTNLAAAAYRVTVRHPPGPVLSLWAAGDCNGRLYHSTSIGLWDTVTQTTAPGLPAECTGPFASPPDIRLDPSDPNQNTLVVSFNPEGLFRSTNNGDNWSKIDLLLDTTTETSPTRLAFAANGTLFVGTKSGRVFSVSGTTATLLPVSTDGTAVTSLTTDPDGKVLVVGHFDGQVESANAFSTVPFSFTIGKCFGTFTTDCSGSPVRDLGFAFDGTTNAGQTALSGSVFAVVGNGIFRSIDLGATFTDARATTDGPAILDSTYNSVTVDPSDATTVWVLGTSSGIFNRTFGPPPAAP